MTTYSRVTFDVEQMSIEESGLSIHFSPDLNEVEGALLGVAIDVGTTTIVCHLHDLKTGTRLATTSQVNPQLFYGADIISRISAAVEGKLDAMHEALIGVLDECFDTLCMKSRCKRADIGRLVLVGNPVMEHIAAHIPPDSIGVTPFTPLSFFDSFEELNRLCPRAYFAPIVSGFVGGDITAGLLATGMYRSPGVHLFIDVGTNGEIVLGGSDYLVSCATAAGPAFEGVGILFGMPATQGAVASAVLKGNSLELGCIGATTPKGICGSGLIDLLACMLKMQVIDETGLLLDADEAPEALAHYLGRENGMKVFYLSADKTLYVTQKDIRNIQLAKGAIHAGIMTLFDECSIGIDDVETLYLAGGFGSHIRLESAAAIGLFPPALLDHACAVGNAAGEGASAVLISQEALHDIQSISQRCRYIELSLHKRFDERFIECLSF